MNWYEYEKRKTTVESIFGAQLIPLLYLQIPLVTCTILGPMNTIWTLAELQGQTLARDTFLSSRFTCYNPMVNKVVKGNIINNLNIYSSIYHYVKYISSLNNTKISFLLVLLQKLNS